MNDKLKPVNMPSFIINSMIGIRLLTFPRDVVEYSHTDGWISILVAGFIAFVTAMEFYWLGLKHSGYNFSQICQITFGKYLGKINMVAIAVYTISSIGLMLRIFGHSIKVFLLDKTPFWVIIGVMSILIVYCIAKGIKTISIVIDLFLPFLIISILLLIFLSMTNAELHNLLPILHSDYKSILKGALQVIDPILSVGIIGYILPYFTAPRKLGSYINISLCISILLYILVVMLCIMVFGSTEITYLIYPTITLSKSIQLKTELFERAESIFMIAWIPITFTTLVLYYWSSTLNLKALFNTKKNKLVTYGQIPFFIFIALFPDNTGEVFKYLSWNGYLAAGLILGLLPITVLITAVKGMIKHEP